MNPEFNALDRALFERALGLLDEEWLTHDAELGPVLPIVLARNVGQDWHDSIDGDLATMDAGSKFGMTPE